MLKVSAVVILALRKLKQEDFDFKTSLDLYSMTYFHPQKNVKNIFLIRISEVAQELKAFAVMTWVQS